MRRFLDCSSGEFGGKENVHRSRILLEDREESVEWLVVTLVNEQRT